MLKNRATDEPLFVVVFTLKPKDGEGEVPDPAKKGEESNGKDGDDLD